MLKGSLFLFLVLCFLTSCEDENLNNIAINQFVVEAFIYAGEPVNDVRIKSTFALLDTADTSTPINDAQVILKKGASSYNLVASGNDGYYSYPGSDLSIDAGDVFQLEVNHNGIIATALTIVPEPTEGLRLSQDTVEVPRLPFNQGRDSVVAVIEGFVGSSRIEAFWNNPESDLHFMTVESVKDTLDPIFPDQVLNALSAFRFVSEPTDQSGLTFLSGSVVSFGQYRVRVYRINEEYAALYENREQDSRDLNEPPSNIQNALGVFSAFNSDDVFFEVVRE